MVKKVTNPRNAAIAPGPNEVAQLYNLKGAGNVEHWGTLFKGPREQGPATLQEHEMKLKLLRTIRKTTL